MKKYFIALILGVVSFPLTAGVAEEKIFNAELINRASKVAVTASYNQATEEDNGNVVITPTGKKYHLKGCRTVKGVYKIITIEQAQRLNYTPCEVCNPAIGS